jgi:serine/threonine kinase PknH
MSTDFVVHPDGTVDPPGGAYVYDEAFEESCPTMSAEDFASANTQKAWALADPPEVSPTQQPYQWAGVLKVVAAAAAAAFGALAAVVVLHGGDGHTETATAAPTTQTVTAAPTTQTQTVIAAPAPPPVTTMPPAAPPPLCGQLRAQASIDGPVMTAGAEGRWIPQLSSKRPGTVDDGQVWDCSSIWREHLQLRDLYDARLLWSGDWPATFKQRDYWVTVAGITYPTADGAQAWCNSHGRDADHCFPTLIQ